MNHGDVFFR
jgi:hypothetical protein